MIGTSSSSSSSSVASSAPLYTQYYPRTYVAPRITSPIVIDGNLSKPIWQQVPWSDLFDDIRGPNDAPPEDRPPLSCGTRIKMLHDDTYLYIGALLHADPDHPVVASFTDRNDPIFQRDSDFEVFIDPTSTTHQYKEFEVNAYNTVWNLLLDKSYMDGGQEHSGRVAKPGQELYYEVRNQHSAVQILEGRANDPTTFTTWSVEIAMSYADLLVVAKTATATTITAGATSHHQHDDSTNNIWRINFSRVERQGDLNWTWQPQVEWNPREKRYQGNVNMHLPNAWGYLILDSKIVSSSLLSNDLQEQQHEKETNAKDELATKTTLTTIPRDPTWPIRMAAMNVYAAQHAYFEESAAAATLQQQHHHNHLEGDVTGGGHFAPHVSDLEEWLDLELMDHVVSHVEMELSASKDSFLAILHGRRDDDEDDDVDDGDDGSWCCSYQATIRNDRFLVVRNATSTGSTPGSTGSSDNPFIETLFRSDTWRVVPKLMQHEKCYYYYAYTISVLFHSYRHATDERCDTSSQHQTLQLSWEQGSHPPDTAAIPNSRMDIVLLGGGGKRVSTSGDCKNLNLFPHFEEDGCNAHHAPWMEYHLLIVPFRGVVSALFDDRVYDAGTTLL